MSNINSSQTEMIFSVGNKQWSWNKVEHSFLVMQLKLLVVAPFCARCEVNRHRATGILQEMHWICLDKSYSPEHFHCFADFSSEAISFSNSDFCR